MQLSTRVHLIQASSKFTVNYSKFVIDVPIAPCNVFLKNGTIKRLVIHIVKSNCIELEGKFLH